jgi:Fe2+ or Zn2+ uptake regulation protein
MNVASVEDKLREHGCTLTPQRRAVLRFLDGNLDHPTAGEIFDAVTRDFPITSRATVYNTLALLEEIGVVRGLPVHGETRYDPNVERHHHLACPICGKLEDVPSSEVTVLLRGKAAEGEVRFVARCSSCS